MFKKVLYLIPLALLATACSDDDEPNVPDGPGYELRTLTFEDADAHFARLKEAEPTSLPTTSRTARM